MRSQIGSILLLVLGCVALALGAPGVQMPGGQVVGGSTTCLDGEIPKASAGVWACASDAGAGTGAPTEATYITQTPHASLSSEQALSVLSTGLVLNTTATGILAIYGGASCTNQFPRSTNASGGWTCASVAEADLNFTPVKTGTAAGGDLMGTYPNPSLGSNVVSNANLADMANATLKCRTTAGTGDPEDCTAAQATALLDTVTTSLKGLAPASGGGTTNFLRADGTWAAPSGGGSAIILDLADDGTNESTALAELATDEANPFVLTEPSADKALLQTGRLLTRWADVVVVATSNLTLSGEQTIDGIVTASSRVLVTGQATPAENWIYVTAAGAWSRATDADSAAEYLQGRRVYVTSGTVHAGTWWTARTAGPITLGTTNLTFTSAPASEKLANKNQPNGYIGANANSRTPFDRTGNFAAHSALAAANTITPTQHTMGIEGSGGPVDLTSNPQIAAGSYHGQRVTLKGTHATNTVQLDHGTGVRLCGNTGSAIVGLNAEAIDLEWNSDLSVWQELGCRGLNRAGHVNRDVFGATSSATAFRPGKDANDHWRLYCSDTECFIEAIIDGAVSPNNTIQLGSGGLLAVKKQDTTVLASLANDTGIWAGTSAPVQPIAKDATDGATVSNTVVETTLKDFTIPSGIIAGNCLTTKMLLRVINNTGASVVYTLRYTDTTIQSISTRALSIGTGSDNILRYDAILCGTTATTQHLSTSAAFGGLYDFGGNHSATIATGSAWTHRLTAEMSVASVSASVQLLDVRLSLER